MQYLCPDIDSLVSCRTCGVQSLPPYRLCLDGHVGCPPCVRYAKQCLCGHRFAAGPHFTFDWLVSALKLRCKYRKSTGDGRCGGSVGGGDDDDCEYRWYEVQELRDHYRTACAKNQFMCPIPGCGHVTRLDTVNEHYESVHGPVDELTPGNWKSRSVTFKLSSRKNVEKIRKAFNGYFMFAVQPQTGLHARDNRPLVAMQNLNPADRIQYTLNAVLTSNRKEILVTLWVVTNNPMSVHRIQSR